VLLKGLVYGVGNRVRTTRRANVKFPKYIVDLLKERKVLESVWKKEKSVFASGRYSDQSLSVLVAAQEMDSKSDELDEAIGKFYRQDRAKLLRLPQQF
jgi:hypothetical protein